MSERQPSRVTNLDRYGAPEVPWSLARERLAAQNGPEVGYFLGTVGADGRPHAAGVGAVWDAGDLYFTSGPGTRKSRNLVARPDCTLSVKLTGLDLTMNGQARQVTDDPTLQRVAAIYRALGWPAQVDGDGFTAPFSAPSAGPPPWHLYRFSIASAVGLRTIEPHGATRWQF